MSHTARTPAALGRWKRPSARLTAVVAVGIALALQVVPPFGSADAARLSASTVHAVAPDPGPDLKVTMSGPTNALPGTTFTDTIQITNIGSDPATALDFVLTPPVAGATYVVDGPGVTCDTTTWHCTVALSPDFAPMAQLLVSLQVQTAAPLDEGSVVAPTVLASTTPTDVDPSNDEATTTTTLTALSHLGVTSSRTTKQVIPGGKVSYRVVVKNNGPNPALTPVVILHPPRSPYSKATKATTYGGTCQPYEKLGDWICTWPTLTVGASKVVTFGLTTSEYLVEGSPYTFIAAANAANADGVTVVEQDSTVTDVSNRATDVSVTSTSTPKVKPNKRGDFEAIITNHGPHRAHGVRLVETVPKGFFWKDPKGRVMLARKSRTTSIPFGDLEVGESKALRGWFRYPTGANLDWNSKVTHTDPDSKASNNTDTSTTRILGPIVQTVTTSTTSDDTVVSATKTSSGSTSSSDTDVDGFKYDGSEQAIDSTSTSSSTGDKEVLADTGGPALRLPLLGFTLVLLGAVSTARSRQLRPAPRHRAWVSPYA